MEKTSLSDDMNVALINFIRLSALFNSVGFWQTSWNKLGGYILIIRIDEDNYDYFNLPICSSLIKCTSKILYNLYTTLLTPNGSRFNKNEFRTRTFQETTMRIGNARYCGALIYRNYLNTRSNINVGCFYFVCCWSFFVRSFVLVVWLLRASFVIELFQSVLHLSIAQVRFCTIVTQHR